MGRQPTPRSPHPTPDAGHRKPGRRSWPQPAIPARCVARPSAPARRRPPAWWIPASPAPRHGPPTTHTAAAPPPNPGRRPPRPRRPLPHHVLVQPRGRLGTDSRIRPSAPASCRPAARSPSNSDPRPLELVRPPSSAPDRCNATGPRGRWPPLWSLTQVRIVDLCRRPPIGLKR
ncbi:Uncharacterised protein [Mycobacterium tuberculosis]|nr:Uncharacterised protein [Mycobacterium tuberculosis]